jgi:hypothetical protein
VLALGIDVGVGKGLDLVAVDGQRMPVHVLPKVGLEQVADCIRELEPDVIAIDAPPAWAKEGRSRLTERTLAERNIRTFATPTRARGKGNPFYDWMEVGFRVFRAAARAGFPRYALSGLLALQSKRFAPGDPKEGVIVLPVVTLPARPFAPFRPDSSAIRVPEMSTLFRYRGCGGPGCQELTRGEFAPGHDIKRKSMLWVSPAKAEMPPTS